MIKLERPLASFDLETTGPDPATAKIVSIAVTKYFPDGTEDKRSMILDPGITIPKEASDVHGITNEQIEELRAKGKAHLFAAIAKSLFAFLDGCDFAGFMIIRFDIPLLSEEFDRVGITFPAPDALLLDAGVIFHKMNERTLSAAYKHYLGKDLEDAHTADADVQAATSVLEKQMELHADEIGTTAAEIHKYCDDGRVDLGGFFVKNEQGHVVMKTGKHKGMLFREVLKNHYGYYTWMMKGDFLSDTKRHAKRMHDLVFPPKK